MFSRAAKSIVKTISQRKYHVGDENKLAMIGGTGGISRSLSQMLKQTSKLDVLALYDVASLNKRFTSIPNRLHNLNIGEPINSEKPTLFSMLEKSQSSRGNIEPVETQELIENLRRLPLAEESAAEQIMKTDRMGSQGLKNANAMNQRGPRVLGEMGPDNFRPNSRIVSELRRQFPNFINHLSKDHSKIPTSSYARRQYSNVAFLYDEKFPINRNMEQESHFVRPVSCIVTSSKERTVSTAKNSFITENVDKRCSSKKRKSEIGEKMNKMTAKHVEKGIIANVDHHRLLTASKIDNKRIRAKKTELKIKNTYSSGTKSKNWTIPAILSDKKPKMLYGLVQQRRRSLSWFFYKFFDVKPEDTANDVQNIKSGSSKINKINCIQDQNYSKQLHQIEKLNASTSISDFTPHTLKTSSNSLSINDSINDSISQGSNLEVMEDISASSIEDSMEESEINSESNDQPQPMKVSSRIAEFLENLRTNRRKAGSSSSLTSYNLDSLFAVEEAPAFSILFSSKDSKDSGSWLKNKIRKCCEKKQPQDDICKKSSSRKSSKVTCKRSDQDRGSKKCGSGDAASCKTQKRTSCTKQDKDSSKKQDKDFCKKHRQQDKCGKSSKREEGGDPCKKLWREDLYGKNCKEERSSKSKKDDKDPCKKLWREDLYGKNCKEGSEGGDPCSKFKKDDTKDSPCKKTKKAAERKESSSSEVTKKKEVDAGPKKAMMKKGTKKQAESEKCPPVFRAPGCLMSGGKSDENRKFSTVASI
nr:uncharacterized protein LOC117605240 isoform X2 [Osmia lignaria]